jgi:restriction system protein
MHPVVELLARAGTPMLLAGGAMLLGVLVLGSNPLFQPAAAALTPLGWLVVAVGAGLRGFGELRAGRPSVIPAMPVGAVEPILRSPDRPEATAGARHEPATVARREPARSVAPDMEPAWSMDLLRRIEWRRFEALCEALVQLDGYSTRSQAYGADGGVDVWLYPASSQGAAESASEPRLAAGIVQCKSWGKPVGEPPVRELLGLKTAHRVSLAILFSVGGFTDGALRFGQAQGLLLVDGGQVLSRILATPRETQLRLLAVATEGDYQRPTCVRCGSKMVLRSGRDRADFWGCERYPLCRHMLHRSSDGQAF